VANGSEVCWSGNPTMCQDGYPTPDSATPPCDPSSVCVAVSGKIFCALSTDPDPACPSDPAVQVCDGQYLLACELGYATSRSTCPSPTVCTVQSVGGATCM
jgi:hypothetical protein